MNTAAPLIFAHRGVISGSFPENSLSAFREAVFTGTAVELDLRITRDGIPVVFHDRTLKRMCGDSRRISAVTYEELGRLRLIGTDESIPTLEQVLELVSGKVPLLIETKLPKRYIWNHRLDRKTAELLKKYDGEYLLQSFNKYSMRYMKRKLPKMKCGILSGKLYPEPDGFDFVSYRLIDVTPQKMDALKKKYGVVFLWSTSHLTDDERRKAVQLSPDGLIV